MIWLRLSFQSWHIAALCSWVLSKHMLQVSSLCLSVAAGAQFHTVGKRVSRDKCKYSARPRRKTKPVLPWYPAVIVSPMPTCQTFKKTPERMSLFNQMRQSFPQVIFIPRKHLISFTFLGSDIAFTVIACQDLHLPHRKLTLVIKCHFCLLKSKQSLLQPLIVALYIAPEMSMSSTLTLDTIQALLDARHVCLVVFWCWTDIDGCTCTTPMCFINIASSKHSFDIEIAWNAAFAFDLETSTCCSIQQRSSSTLSSSGMGSLVGKVMDCWSGGPRFKPRC